MVWFDLVMGACIGTNVALAIIAYVMEKEWDALPPAALATLIYILWFVVSSGGARS